MSNSSLISPFQYWVIIVSYNHFCHGLYIELLQDSNECSFVCCFTLWSKIICLYRDYHCRWGLNILSLCSAFRPLSRRDFHHATRRYMAKILQYGVKAYSINQSINQSLCHTYCDRPPHLVTFDRQIWWPRGPIFLAIL